MSAFAPVCAQCRKPFGNDQCGDFMLCWPCVNRNQARIDGMITSEPEEVEPGLARLDGKKFGPIMGRTTL